MQYAGVVPTTASVLIITRNNCWPHQLLGRTALSLTQRTLNRPAERLTQRILHTLQLVGWRGACVDASSQKIDEKGSKEVTRSETESNVAFNTTFFTLKHLHLCRPSVCH